APGQASVSREATTVLPTPVSVPVTNTPRGGRGSVGNRRLAQRRGQSLGQRRIAGGVLTGVNREAQPRGALGHGGRADGADVEAGFGQGGGRLQGGGIRTDHHRNDGGRVVAERRQPGRAQRRAQPPRQGHHL